MKQTGRKYSPVFKAEVALEALKGQETLSELSKRFNVSSEMISRWKKEFMKNASNAFAPSQKPNASDKIEKALYKKIDRLQIKLDFAKQVSEKLGISIPIDD